MATKRFAALPEERTKTCAHPLGFAWNGKIPCTGRKRCALCGLTEEDAKTEIGTNAIGIHDKDALVAISKDVPDSVRAKDCKDCLWHSCECKNGSLYDPSEMEDKHCNGWMYYD